MAKGSGLAKPSVLAFDRKLDVSDGLFSGGKWADIDESGGWTPLELREKSVRGVISNRLKANVANDPAKLDAEVQKPNPQRVDVCTLAMDQDAFKLEFTLKVLPAAGGLSACNNKEFSDKLATTFAGYQEAHRYEELATRYAWNLANGRFLWRNRVGAEEIKVRVEQLEKGSASKTWDFDGFDFDIRSLRDSDRPALKDLGESIAAALRGESRFTLFKVQCWVRCGNGQEVYPSQEMILDQEKGSKSKVLYSVNSVAGVHSQKIGNAIRTIDTWYETAQDNGPIAAEVYGSVTTLGTAFRNPKSKTDFYSLFDGWILKDKVPSEVEQHFVMAVLIRGGVFGEASS